MIWNLVMYFWLISSLLTFTVLPVYLLKKNKPVTYRDVLFILIGFYFAFIPFLYQSYKAQEILNTIKEIVK